jgi:hypothetical protein
MNFDRTLASVALAAVIFLAPIARADIIPVIDIIPNADSSETGQNSEPSIAVDPLNSNQMISGAFNVFNSTTTQVSTPYFQSTNGGTTWSDFGSLNTDDKSLAWRQDGVAALNVTLNQAGLGEIGTFQSGASNFGAAINTLNPGANLGLDQPWIRTGPSGKTYVTYNQCCPSPASDLTASIRVSSDNGVTYAAPITLETVKPGGLQDAPSVRSAVNGNTVYAVFTRWGASIANDANGQLFGSSSVVIVKSTDAGTTFSSGVTGATTTGYFANVNNTPLTLGQNRTSSDVAIAVDPRNANHVVVAYGDANETSTSTGLLQLHVIESTDGGATWTQKFTTSASVRSALPGITITANGGIALLYAQYDPTTAQLSQHLLTTINDFATTQDSLLGRESNATPTLAFNPYLGDYYDLTSIGDQLFGIFSASNADNGTSAFFPDVSFQRDFTGTPGTPSFDLVSLNDATVPFSIDPFFFSVTLVPEPNSLVVLGAALLSLLGLTALRRRHR